MPDMILGMGGGGNKTPCLFCEPAVFCLPFHHCLFPGPYWPSLTWTPEKYLTCSPALLSPFSIRPLITAYLAQSSLPGSNSNLVKTA